MARLAEARQAGIRPVGSRPAGQRWRAHPGLLWLGLIVANLAAWAWALLAFRHYPILLGTALLAYGFGLRHAVDADHIAAIDNVTRKLMQDGQRPLCVGLFFSLGHSTIVVAASIGVAATATRFGARLGFLHGIGGIVGTLVSSAFLLAIAAMNVAILLSLRRSFRRVRAGEHVEAGQLELLLSGRGFFARVFRPLFRRIGRSWHMYPLGVLFGLGFDTATEVSLLGISAAGACHGMPVWSILVFPALFTAGMSLVDTVDGVLMLGAYGWAFVHPLRKLYYNMAITLVSVVVAVLVGGIEALGLIEQRLGPHGLFWHAVDALNRNLGVIGYLTVGVFVLGWLGAVIVYRARGCDRLGADI